MEVEGAFGRLTLEQILPSAITHTVNVMRSSCPGSSALPFCLGPSLLLIIFALSIIVVLISYSFVLSASGKEFQGRRLKVSMARRKPVPGGMRGGMPMRGGPDRGGKSSSFKNALKLLCTLEKCLNSRI